MRVLLPCALCHKTLRIPEHVLGRSVQCPSCGAVFLAQREHSRAAAERPRPAPVPAVPPLDDDEDEFIVPEVVGAGTDPADVVIEDDEEAADVVIEDAEDEAPAPPEKTTRSKRRLPFYLPILAVLPLGIAPAFPVMTAMMGKHIEFDTSLIIGIASAVGLTALCLIVSLLPIRVWIRLLVVLLLVFLGYAVPLAWLGWSYYKDPGKINVPRMNVLQEP
jgi:hypothetical protein